MDALILNSGIGSRIRGVLGEKPKGLIEVHGGEPLLIYQLKALLSVNVSNVIITTGYKHDEIITCVENYFGKTNTIQFIHNPYFESTNYIYSIYLCLSKLVDDIILMHGDLYFSNNIISEILDQNFSLVTVDSTEPPSDKDFKAKITNGRVIEISTTLKGEDCVSCQPLYRLNKDDWLKWANVIRKFCINKKNNVYAEDALNEILADMKLFPYDLLGELCMEIDTAEDLHKLQERILTNGKG